ncbi:MAG: HAMP domain-containing protein [Chloroflexi bacterium]|nr:HAMP domain-containing protein [Chloroflexota bacterium]
MMMLRSLTWKLTLAFLGVGLIGAVVVALLARQSARTEFDRFLSERDQTELINAVTTFYMSYSTWDGLEAALNQEANLAYYRRSATLFDRDGKVILANGPYVPGMIADQATLNATKPLTVANQTVGYIAFGMIQTAQPPAPSADQIAKDGPRPQDSFDQRITWAIGVSAIFATSVALLVGTFLARRLTRSLRELTVATQAMAAGQLEQQVAVRSNDEIGDLARSFNHMSADLSKATHLRKQMTADLAHDLRTPLSILRGYAEGLRDGVLQPSETIYTVIFDEVTHLQRLVDDLRVLSLADAGELSLNRRLVDPAALIERTILSAFVQAERQNIELKLETEAGLPSVSVDTDRMAQVLNNLVSNALRHTKQGSISLIAKRQAQQVQLIIRDTGSGIDPADVPYIFARFYRGDSSRQREDQASTGLGLAIVKAIVEAHEGQIEVESSLGEGTSFIISLPIA